MASGKHLLNSSFDEDLSDAETTASGEEPVKKRPRASNLKQKDPDAQTNEADLPSSSADTGGKRKRILTKELRCMMYGFGDDKVPYTETIELLEDLTIEYLKNVTQRAMEVGKTGRVQLEDVWYLIRRDPRKYARVKDLLTMNEELRKARKAFDEAKFGDGVK